MTSRADELAEGPQDDGAKGVGRRLLSKIKTALKKADPSKRSSTLSAPAVRPAPPPPIAAPEPHRSPPAVGPSVEQTAQTSSQLSTSAPAGSRALGVDDTSAPANFEGEKIPRSQIYGERAQHLVDSYGLEMDPYAWYQMDGSVIRVHKTAHIRVHRRCHECGNEIGQGKQCDACNHKFCRQCSRYPPRRTESELSASRDRRADITKERSANAMISPDWKADAHGPVVLKRPSKPSGQRELVYKKIRQRVRRTCCQCLEADASEVTFQSGGRSCPKCNHTRCTDCPRDPPKKDKYPYGYPGDEFGAKSIPHYRCHECFSKFPVGVENGTQCLQCSHEKCDDCERLLPQKVEPEPDPEVLRSVEEKLAAMHLRAIDRPGPSTPTRTGQVG